MFGCESESEETVSQLLLTPKSLLLFEFRVLCAFLSLQILNCWTTSESNKSKKKHNLFSSCLIQITNYELSITNGILYFISMFHALFENFTGIKFLFFHFKGCSEFSIKNLPNFLYMCLFSQLHRLFFRHFANRAVIYHIFEWKSTRKAFIVIWPI